MVRNKPPPNSFRSFDGMKNHLSRLEKQAGNDQSARPFPTRLYTNAGQPVDFPKITSMKAFEGLKWGIEVLLQENKQLNCKKSD